MGDGHTCTLFIWKKGFFQGTLLSKGTSMHCWWKIHNLYFSLFMNKTKYDFKYSSYEYKKSRCRKKQTSESIQREKNFLPKIFTARGPANAILSLHDYNNSWTIDIIRSLFLFVYLFIQYTSITHGKNNKVKNYGVWRPSPQSSLAFITFTFFSHSLHALINPALCIVHRECLEGCTHFMMSLFDNRSAHPIWPSGSNTDHPGDLKDPMPHFHLAQVTLQAFSSKSTQFDPFGWQWRGFRFLFLFCFLLFPQDHVQELRCSA